MEIKRAQFEEWYKKEFPNLPTTDRLVWNDLNNEYQYPFVDGMFLAWRKLTIAPRQKINWLPEGCYGC